MQWRDNQHTYGLITVFMHWAIAALIFMQLAMVAWSAQLDIFDSRLATLAMWHKSFGVLVAILMLLRLCWRLPAANPKPKVKRSNLARLLGRSVRFLLYLTVFVLTLSGLLLAIGADRGFMLFALVEVQALHLLDKSTLAMCKSIHIGAVRLLLVLLALHVLAVIKHQWLDGDSMLQRMFGRG